MKRLLTLILSVIFLAPTLGDHTAVAVSPSVWKAGRIIDDALFLNKDSMTVEQIQQFLNSKLPSCDTYGQKLVTYRYPFGTGPFVTTTRAVYADRAGNPKPTGQQIFTCLKDYYEVSKIDPGPGEPANNYGGKPIPQGARSAAQIIWDAAQAYGISPKVLLINLHKEQALITDEWPLQRQYLYAMGAQCPDSTGCNPNYAGFSLQMHESAKLFKYYIDSMTQPWWPYKKPYTTQNIPWHPDSNCGSSPVYIESRATAALYTYTPYQPNQAALNAGYGTGDSCSSYGNRNFWLFYNDWFGPTLGSLVRTLASPDLYFTDGQYKFIVPSMAVMVEFGFSMNDVRYVSQAEMDAMPIPGESSPFSSSIGQIIKSHDDADSDGGAIYLVTNGFRIPIASMQQFSDFGFTTDMIRYLPLSSVLQITPYGQQLSNFLQAPDLSVFKMENGKRRMVADLATLIAHNPSGNVTRVSLYTLSQIPYGVPLANNDLLFIGPDNGLRLLQNGKTYTIPTMNVYECWGFSKIVNIRIGSYSVLGGAPSAGTLGCFAQNSAAQVYLMGGTVRHLVPSQWAVGEVPTINDVTINRLPDTGAAKSVLRSPSGALAVIENGTRRSIPTLAIFNELGYQSSDITQISDSTFYSIPAGAAKYSVGTLLLEPDGSISITVSDNSRRHIRSIGQFLDYGFGGSPLINAATTDLQAYASPGSLDNFINVDGVAIIVDSGKTFALSNTELQTAYNKSPASLITAPPQVIRKASAVVATRFIRSYSDPSVYYMDNGQKRPIPSWQRVVELGGQNSIIYYTSAIIQTFPTGPPI